MNAKKVNISVSLPEPLRKQAKKAASDDNRSVSSLVSSLLKSYLVREGYVAGGKEEMEEVRLRQTRLSYW